MVRNGEHERFCSTVVVVSQRNHYRSAVLKIEVEPLI
jgi:hypothetical protein